MGGAVGLRGDLMPMPDPAGDADAAIVIPAYNEAASIADVTRRACAVTPCVIVVDDGSVDCTAVLAEANGALALRNVSNSGKGAALRRGMKLALSQGVRYVVTLDGDGQHRPEDVVRLLDCARRHPDRIVIGSRRADGAAVPRSRYIANRVADFWISWASGYPIDDTQSGFRVYPAEVLRRVGADRQAGQGFVFESEILISAGWHGHRTVSIDIDALYGAVLKRRSHFRPVTDIAKIVVMVAGKLLRRGMHPAGLWRWLEQFV